MAKIPLNCNRENPPMHRISHHFLPCNACGSQSRRIGAGKVPGGASPVCVCGRFIKWLSASEAQKGGQI